MQRLLAPKALTTVAALGATVTDLKFGPAVSMTAIIAAALVIVMGGLFTLRNNMKTFWRNLAEERGEQVKVLEREHREQAAQLLEMQATHAAEKLREREAQRDVRHGLKAEVAGLRGELEVERTKHDLSSIQSRLDALESMFVERDALFEGIAEAVAESHSTLTKIADVIVPADSPPIQEVAP